MSWREQHGLAASMIDSVKHQFDRLREPSPGADEEEDMQSATNLKLRRELEDGDDKLRIGLDLDLKLKGTRRQEEEGENEPQDEDRRREEEDTLDAEDAAQGIEDDSDENSEEEDEDPEARAGEEEDEDEEDIEASADEQEDEENEDVEARDEEEDEDEEDIEASADEEEDEEDEDVEAREGGEDEGEDEEDEDVEAREGGEDEEEDEDDVEAREEDEEDEDDSSADDEEEENELHDTPREKRAALRSAGDSSSLRAVPKRANDNERRASKPETKPAKKKSPADKVIAIAKRQEGYREGKKNYTKFAAELIKAKVAQKWWQNKAWCQTFQAWAFVEAGHKKLAPMTPGCATAVAWFRKRKRVNQYPAIGAQVFYGSGGDNHVGLVYKYNPTHIWTIEGNTNGAGSAEGIGVFLKRRSRKSAYVYGYGYPKYPGGIVTADPRKKGQPGFTFRKAAASGARDSASEPVREEKSLPWVSVEQVQWAATHSASAERAAKAGKANPRDDVKRVQEALVKVMGTRSKDPAGIYEQDTERLFNRFRRDKLKMVSTAVSAKPGPKALAALGRRSKLFRVRTGSTASVDEQAGSTTPARISTRDVTFKRTTASSSPEKITKWIRKATKKAGATPSRAWVQGFKTMIKRESGGNPNVCNLWDSNAKTPAGFRKVKDFGDGVTRSGICKLNGRRTHFQCSRGIVQSITQTIARHHARGTSRNIYDPVASIAASTRYVMSRYNVAKNGANFAKKVRQADPSRGPGGY
jgi:chemotaxis protein histidine kinase CheA